jgi:hypothetical protein
MTTMHTTITTESVDEHTWVFKLTVPIHTIVFIQACLESYEGVAVVRTVDPEAGLIELICSNDMADECANLINSIILSGYTENFAVSS